MKSVIFAFVLSLLLFSTSNAQYCSYLPGDINSSGSVIASDVTYGVRYLKGIGTPPPDSCTNDSIGTLNHYLYVAADVNASCTFAASDITRLVAYFKGTAILQNCRFFPFAAETVTDIDGNIYQTVTIGTQVWMAENLKVTHYRNGNDIPNVTDNTAWTGLSTGAYCNYNNDVNNVATYGRLYNWYAVGDSRNIVPAGWHVPTDAEWKQLEMYLGMSQAQADLTGWRGTVEGGKMKEAGFTHWLSPNTGATNESGFSALPGGFRINYGYDYNVGFYAFFWSSTEYGSSGAWSRHLYYLGSEVGRDNYDMRFGFSVRCVRD